MPETKHAVLGMLVNATTYDEVITAVVHAAQSSIPLTVSAAAVHAVMQGVFDRAFRSRLNQFDFVVPDGQPVRWALRLLHGIKLPDRVYGPTLTLELCRTAERCGLRVFFYGTTDETLNALSVRLLERYPNLRIVGMRPSRFRQLTDQEQQVIDEEIISSRAQIVFVGLGCPRQEIWTYEHRDTLGIPIIAVGAAFDFLSGKKKQAPVWMQRRGLEWFFRLTTEPHRLWRRYVLLNPVYIVLIALQWLRLKTIDPARDTIEDKLHYG